MALCLEVFCWEAFKCGGILLGGIFLWRDFARGFFLRRDLSLEGFLLIAFLYASLLLERQRNKIYDLPIIVDPAKLCYNYSIVKDSSADLGVNFKIVQNRPTVKAVCTKISKKNFLQNFCY